MAELAAARRRLLLEFPYWPGLPRGNSSEEVANYAEALLSGATFDQGPGFFVARQPLPWDSEKLGVLAGKLSCVFSEGPSADGRAPFEERSGRLREAVLRAKAEGFGYLFLRLDAGDNATIMAAEQAGFVMVDAIYTQVMECAWLTPPPPNRVVIREATSADAALMGDLVDDTIRYSRFHADPKVGMDRARAIYREWGENTVKGLNTLTLIGELDGEAAGYVSLKTNRLATTTFGKGHVRVELVGVRPRFRGQHVVQALTAECVRRASEFGWDELAVGTQISNVTAIRAYQKCGFRPGDAVVSLRWRADDDALSR